MGNSTEYLYIFLNRSQRFKYKMWRENVHLDIYLSHAGAKTQKWYRVPQRASQPALKKIASHEKNWSFQFSSTEKRIYSRTSDVFQDYRVRPSALIEPHHIDLRDIILTVQGSEVFKICCEDYSEH